MNGLLIRPLGSGPDQPSPHPVQHRDVWAWVQSRGSDPIWARADCLDSLGVGCIRGYTDKIAFECSG